MVGGNARTVLAAFGIGDVELCGIGADLILGQLGATGIAQRAQRDIAQAVAAGADLGIDLQTALKLELVIGAERAFEAEGDVLDMCGLVAGGRGLALGGMRVGGGFLGCGLNRGAGRLFVRGLGGGFGSRLGSVSGAGTALAERAADGSVRLVPGAPLLGSARLDIPSIAWAGPLADQNLKTDGSLKGEFTLAGTPAQPG